MTSAINVLDWKPAGSLQDFIAPINDHEHFVIQFNASQPEGYQWQLLVKHSFHGAVFLHGHTTLEEAKHAALVHIGEV